jgi:hypothetical protein
MRVPLKRMRFGAQRLRFGIFIIFMAGRHFVSLALHMRISIVPDEQNVLLAR